MSSVPLRSGAREGKNSEESDSPYAANAETKKFDLEPGYLDNELNEASTDEASVGPSSSSRASSSDDEFVQEDQLPMRGIFSKREKMAYYGYIAQYVAVGLVSAGIGATFYGVFLGYLNVPGYVFSTTMTVCGLPWSFKFLFGLINDTCPIRGRRRKPYMMIGWGLCAIMLLAVANTPLPEPYWCVDPLTGEYIKKQELADGRTEQATPCHPESAQEGGKYAVMLMLATLGYVIADVAADGLLTEYAKAEPLERRGNTQTTAYMTKACAQAVSLLFVGLGMNARKYNGSFARGLDFQAICFVFSMVSALMVPITAVMVKEIKSSTSETMTFGSYMDLCWDLLQSKACFYVILFSFLRDISSIFTTAGPLVKKEWAGVQNLQNQLFSLFGHLLFASGLWLVKKKLLNKSWRMMLIVTTVFLQVVDFFFSTLTIFNVVRNQYFYLGEAVLTEIPRAASFVVSLFIVVEMADDGNEGMVYGLLTTAGNLGHPVARAAANQIYRLFTPSLSDAANYIEDTPAFRMVVFQSFVLSYAFSFLSLGTLYLLPDQKEEAQRRKREWSRRPVYGWVTIVLLSVSLAYSLSVSFLSMSPKTMCMKYAGGGGCHHHDGHGTVLVGHAA